VTRVKLGLAGAGAQVVASAKHASKGAATGFKAKAGDAKAASARVSQAWRDVMVQRVIGCVAHCSASAAIPRIPAGRRVVM
jgi:hypothetical protein